MKAVCIYVAKGVPVVRWRDSSMDDWLGKNSKGRWTRYTPPPGDRLGEHITRLWEAAVSMPAFTAVVPNPESRQIPLVYPEAFIAQPKGFEYDWVQILRFVQKATGDFDLELVIDSSNEMRGKAAVIVEQKIKTSKARVKRGETLKEKLPTDAQIIHAYHETVKAWGGRWVHGDPDSKESFLRDIIKRVDEQRKEEGQIEMDDYWDVSTGYVYQKCSKLKLLGTK